MLDDIKPLDPERFRLKVEAPKPKAPKHKRPLWAKVPLSQLTDRNWDSFYPPKTRLLLYLWIRSYQGKRTVRVTNTMAAEIGLTRQQKAACLHKLEAQGLITVARVGHSAPEVTCLSGDDSMSS